MPLVFSTSSVRMLWVYSWLGQCLWGGLFGLEWSSLWSSIRVSQFSVCIYSFQLQVCRVWRCIFKTQICVCHLGPAFSSLSSFYVLLKPVEVYVHLFFIDSAFYYDLFVPIFCSKIFLPLSHPVVDMASPILPLMVGRFFSLFWNVLFCLYCLA